MSYELLHEDDDMYKLKHPNGKEVVIAKKALSDAFHQKVRSMFPIPKKMAFGGYTVEGTDKLMAPFAGPVEDGEEVMTPATPDVQQSNQIGGELAGNGDIPVTPTPSPVGNPKKVESPKTTMMEDLKALAGDQKKAIKDKGQAESDLAKEQEAATNVYGLDQKQSFNDHIARSARFDSELQQMQQDIMHQKIDPHRLWNDASTGQKAAAGIGVMLAGIGAGLAGGPNQAIQMIDKMAERDIQAQKMELGKKNTLYSMNMQRFNNENAAYMATKIQMADAYKAQMAAAAAKANSKVAMANAQMAMGQIDQGMLPMKMELKKWEMGQDLLYGSGGASNQAQAQRSAEMVLPKEDKERLIYVPGAKGGVKPVLAPTKEDAENFRKAEISNNELEEKLDNAIGFMKKHGTIMNPYSQAAGTAKTTLGGIKMSMSQLHGLNRLSDVDLEEFSKMLPEDLGQIRTEQGIKQLEAVKKELIGKRNAAYSQYAPGHSASPFKKSEGAPTR